MSFAYCSSCDHSEEYGEAGLFYHLLKSKNKNPKPIPKPDFCVKCGFPMLHGCCNIERKTMDNLFCPKCGKPYKTIEE